MNNEQDYLQSLRARTASLHGEVEAVTQGDRFFTEPFDRTHYSSFLLSHYLFHLEVARHVAAWPELQDALLDWPDCNRIEGLRADLHRIGVTFDQSDGDAPPSLPLHSPAFAVGLCYVSEGSALGSKQIHASLGKDPLFSSMGADRFFSISRDELAERWKSFLILLLKEAERNYQNVEQGAVAGFVLFRRMWEYVATEHQP